MEKMKEKTQCYTEYYTDREENQEILLRCLDRIYKQGYWSCYLELKGFDYTLSIFLVVKLENKLEDLNEPQIFKRLRVSS